MNPKNKGGKSVRLLPEPVCCSLPSARENFLNAEVDRKRRSCYESCGPCSLVEKETPHIRVL